MRIWIDVNRSGKGAGDFLKALPTMLKDADTWTLVKRAPTSAVIQSTATITSLPEPPTYKLSESMGGAGSVDVELVNGQDWSAEQKAHALAPFVYLCGAALRPYVGKLNVEFF